MRKICENCVKLNEFIEEKLNYTNSGYDLAIDVFDFINKCECEEKENEFEEDDK